MMTFATKQIVRIHILNISRIFPKTENTQYNHRLIVIQVIHFVHIGI